MAKMFITTPFGVAKFPKLHEKDKYEGEETNYNVTIILDAASFASFKKEFDEKIKGESFSTKTPKLPFKKLEDEDEGLFQVKPTSNYKPTVFDSKKQELPADVIVGGGSELRASCEIAIYKNRKGVSLRLNAVQVKSLVEHQGSGSASAFDEVEDGFVADTSAADGFDGGEADGNDALDI